MARPSRNKAGKTADKQVTEPVAADPSVEKQAKADAASAEGATQAELAARDAELEKLRAQLAEGEAAKAKLQQDLEAAQQRAAEANLSNEDFREQPPPGQFFYYLVRFDPKRNEGDTEDVEAAVNGDWMVWKRGVETGLRSDYREVLENAVQAKFTVLPGQDRKEVGALQTYTFNILKRISQSEYLDLLKQGNTRLKESIVHGG